MNQTLINFNILDFCAFALITVQTQIQKYENYIQTCYIYIK